LFRAVKGATRLPATRWFLIAALFAAVWPEVSGQEVELRDLEIRSTLPLSGQAAIFSGSLRCDAESAIYAQPFSPDRTAALLRISSDGKKVVQISLGSVPGFDKASIVDYAVSWHSGEVYVLTQKEREDSPYLVRFTNDGRYRSTVRLEHRFHPSSIALFKSGNVLVFGQHEVRKRSTPFLGIFGDNGQLKQRIEKLEGDLPPPSTPGDSQYDDAMAGTLLYGSGGGLVYLARATRVGPVFAINEGGQVQHTFRLPEYETTELFEVRVEGGQMLVVHMRQQEKDNYELLLSVLEPTSGKLIRAFRSKDPEMGVAVGCQVGGDTFTFLGADAKGRLRLVEAAPSR
jgi:hypothetical protein